LNVVTCSGPVLVRPAFPVGFTVTVTDCVSTHPSLAVTVNVRFTTCTLLTGTGKLKVVFAVFVLLK
jgi:hypothetical protein